MGLGLQCFSILAKGTWMKNGQFRFGRSFHRRPKLTDRLRERSVTLNKFNTHDVSVVGSATLIADCQSLFLSFQASTARLNDFCTLL
jgi:hypothetical protein